MEKYRSLFLNSLNLPPGPLSCLLSVHIAFSRHSYVVDFMFVSKVF